MLNLEVVLEDEDILDVALEILVVEIISLLEATSITLRECIMATLEVDIVEVDLLGKLMLSILSKHLGIHHKLLEMDLLVLIDHKEVLEI